MDNDHTNDGGGRESDVVGELIRRAGRRENPSAEEYACVFAAATDALEHKIRRRRRRFVAASLAAAAVAGILATVVVTNLPMSPVRPIAALDRIVGPAELAGGGAPGWRAVTADGATLVADTRLRTGPGSRLGVLMHNGVSLRLAESTEVRFAAPGTIELVAGKIYADAGIAAEGAAPGRRIVVETPAGATWDVGTQFEVLYAQGIYRLRVREGRVNLTQDSRELHGEAGEQLTIDGSRQVRRERIARDDPEWKWTESVAPDPVIDARPVSVFLEWVSRQTGREVQYAHLDLELRAETTILYGSVYFVEPLDALETMLATTDFDYTLLDDGTILIDSRK